MILSRSPVIRISTLLVIPSMLTILSLNNPGTALASPLQYTLPFQGQYMTSCPFGPYSQCGLTGWHYGTDFVLGNDEGGHPVLAAARGVAERCPFSSTAGWFVVVDHGSGYVTRYLHFQSEGLTNDGDVVARGEIIG